MSNYIISKYPRIFQDYLGNPGRVNWEIPKGWQHIVDWLCGSLQQYIDYTTFYDRENGEVHPHQIQCTQVKEKFGELQFYTNGADDIEEGMIRFAQYLSEITCIQCGSMTNVEMQTTGWVMPLCEKCKSN